MSKEALLKLREPAAFALLGAGALQMLAGLVGLFAKGGFTYHALSETSEYGHFTNLSIAVVTVLAVLFVTKGAEQNSPQARNVVMAALGVLGFGLLFGAVCLLAGLLAGGESTTVGGVTYSITTVSGNTKIVAFFFGIAKLVITGVAGYFVFLNFQALQPARPAPLPGGLGGGQVYGGQQYGQYGQPGQQGQPYGDPYQQQAPPPGAYNDPYSPPPSPSQPQPGPSQPQPGQYGQPQYGAPDPYAQGQPGPSQPQPGQYGQPGQGQPGHGQPGQYGQQPPQDQGGWTRQFGEEPPQHGQQSDQNWYRGDQGPQ
ncbi:hypothetical protein [Actinocorallia longicatena]|uniref:Uncharacterized protein n=1 Tax=Actinocorallia longicatena TaxID=111803 RepID=A0ABP6QMH3_9ACTN